MSRGFWISVLVIAGIVAILAFLFADAPPPNHQSRMPRGDEAMPRVATGVHTPATPPRFGERAPESPDGVLGETGVTGAADHHFLVQDAMRSTAGSGA